MASATTQAAPASTPEVDAFISQKARDVLRKASEKSIFAAFLEVWRHSNAPVSEQDMARMLTLTPFHCRYVGFLHSISPAVRNCYRELADGYHSMEQVFIKRCRLNNIMGITCKNILNVIAELVNSEMYDHVRNLGGWAFSAMDTSARCMLIMEDVNYPLLANDDGDRPLGRGELFGSLMCIYRCVDLCDQQRNVNTSGSIQRLLSELKRYLMAFATALMRTIVLHVETIKARLERDVDSHGSDALNKLRCAALRGLLIYALRATAGARSGCVRPASENFRWGALKDMLSQYDEISKERVMRENILLANDAQTSNMLRERYTMLNIIERLQADCSSVFLNSAECLLPGGCDSNFMTIRTAAPANPVRLTEPQHRELMDPAVKNIRCCVALRLMTNSS